MDDKRIHEHRQAMPYKFDIEHYAPARGDDSRGRFSVKCLVYIPSLGWDIVNPMTKENEVMIGFRDFVRMNEIMGYVHTGKTSKDITQTLNNLWGTNLV